MVALVLKGRSSGGGEEEGNRRRMRSRARASRAAVRNGQKIGDGRGGNDELGWRGRTERERGGESRAG
jgi:hypothetical protein